MSSARMSIRRAFDRAAASYDGAAALQREVARRLADRLDGALESLCRLPGRALDLGSGTGYGEALLRRALQGAELLELDISPAMLKIARARRGAENPCGAVCGDLEHLPLAAGCVDLAWSSLALQWVGDGRLAFAEICRCLSPGGVLLFSTLGPRSLWELGQAFAGVDHFRHVNRFADGPALRASLAGAGLEVVTLEQEDIVVDYADARQVMRDLKAIGARRVLEDGVPGLMGKARWGRAVDNYEALRRDGQLPATYDVIYGMARKP